MTDISKVYLDEAVRRLNDGPNGRYYAGDWTAEVIARTLQELGWQPPVDPMLVRAREIAARALRGDDMPGTAKSVLEGRGDDERTVQAALIALREGMGK